jgi:hypothetical protein
VATEAPKTIGQAIEDVTDEDLDVADDADDDESVDDDTDTGEDDADDDDGSDDDDDGSDDDDPDADADDDDADDDDDDDDADWGVDDDDATDDDADFFEDLTPEQLAEVKENPKLNALRKQLMKGYEKKTTTHSNMVKLGEAYKKNPLGVLKAIADQMGLDVVNRAEAKKEEPEGEKEPSKLEVAAQRIEKLFGDKAGPEVREALKEFVSAANEEALEPVNKKLTKSDLEAEQARYLQEEADFRVRHAKQLTPEIEDAVVKLGESKKIAPGEDMSAGEYLDMLLEITLARQGKQLVKEAGRKAGEKLRKKIDRNKKNREPRGRGSKSGVRKVSRLEQPEKIRSISEAIELAAADMDDDFEE